MREEGGASGGRLLSFEGIGRRARVITQLGRPTREAPVGFLARSRLCGLPGPAGLRRSDRSAGSCSARRVAVVIHKQLLSFSSRPSTSSSRKTSCWPTQQQFCLAGRRAEKTMCDNARGVPRSASESCRRGCPGKKRLGRGSANACGSDRLLAAAYATAFVMTGVRWTSLRAAMRRQGTPSLARKVYAGDGRDTKRLPCWLLAIKQAVWLGSPCRAEDI